MASSPAAVEAWRRAKEFETGLRQLLEKPDATYAQIEGEILGFRLASQETILLDFDLSLQESVGARLWEAHGLINKAYRKKLDKLKNNDPKQVAVEQRKVTKHYADFLKTSTHFYKGLIQCLSSYFGELPRLARIAGAMRVEVPAFQNPNPLSPEKHHLLEAAVHATLLRLGDLARYRSLLRTKEPGWEISLGFLNLANDLCPEDPNAHHQMAVVALARDNHLDALYHFFLALNAIQAPPALAKKNLAIECKKIQSAWKKHQVAKGMNQSEKFIWWFVVLQSAFHRGDEFSAHLELENQVLTDLVPLLKEESFDDILQKCVVISIAAESTAVSQIKEQGGQSKPETLQSFYFSIAFNVNLMNVLLQNFVAELPANSDVDSEDFSSKFCRIIPALRQYSIWLANSSDMILQFATTSDDRHRNTRIMWQLYAKALTGIAQSYSISTLTRVAYLLEEDTRTAGFALFRNSELANFYIVKDNAKKETVKPHFNDIGVNRQDPSLEMGSRMYDIIVTALNMVGAQKIPLALGKIDGHFEYDEEWEFRRAYSKEFASNAESAPEPAPNAELVPYLSPADSDEMSRNAQKLTRCRTVECVTPVGYGNTSLSSNYVARPDHGYAQDPHEAMEADMQQMVDNLLGPHLVSADETSYGMDSLVAEEVFAPMGSNGYRSRFPGTPTMLPSLPGLYTNAFTPQANELGPRQLSPLSLSTKEKRLSAAFALDEQNGLGGGSPWGKPSRYAPNPISHSVNQSLQDSLAQQYASSGFSNSSGLFPDATQQRRGFNADPFAGNGFSGNRHGNDSTVYPGATDFERNVMLQSSLWNGSQPHKKSMRTPPGGQG